jgi:hypothetical protein
MRTTLDAAWLGYIHPFGILQYWTSSSGGTTVIGWSAGCAYVNGAMLTYAGGTATMGQSDAGLSAAGVWHHYLYDNSGTPTVEMSQTAPVWDSTYGYWRKGADATRRMIGFHFVFTNVGADPDANEISPFTATTAGRRIEITWALPRNTASGTNTVNAGVCNLVTNGTATTMTSVSLSAVVPSNAVAAYLNTLVTGTSAGDDISIGVSPTNLDSTWIASGTSLGASVQTVRNSFVNAGGGAFPGRVWVNIVESQTIYYCVAAAVGATPKGTIRCHGAAFNR